MTKNDDKCVPALRFKGFNNDWAQRMLGEISIVNSGKDYKQLNKGNIPVYGTGGYMLSVDQYLSKNDAVGIGRKGTIDHPQYLKAPFWTVDTLFFMTVRENNNLHYLYSLFQKINWKKYDESTGLPSLSKKTINNISVKVPEYIEQKRIGNFISQVDSLLSLQQRKLQQLKLLKKAMLQDLFADKAVPKLRFRGFKDYWVPKKLGDIANFINGRAYKQNELLDKGKYKVLRVGNFYTNDSWYFSNLELKPQYYINKGDLVYTWSATFGPHIWRGEKVIYHYHIWKINLSKSLNKKFVFYLLKADKAKLLSNTNGSTMIHITKRNMESKTVLIPNTIEQSQIRNSLDNVSNLITFQQEKIAEVKQIKQFLLQNMFI